MKRYKLFKTKDYWVSHKYHQNQFHAKHIISLFLKLQLIQILVLNSFNFASFHQSSSLLILMIPTRSFSSFDIPFLTEICLFVSFSPNLFTYSFFSVTPLRAALLSHRGSNIIENPQIEEEEMKSMKIALEWTNINSLIDYQSRNDNLNLQQHKRNFSLLFFG